MMAKPEQKTGARVSHLLRRYLLFPSAEVRAAWLLILWTVLLLPALLAALVVPILLRHFGTR
jgi:hypothetical protein